MRVAVVGAGIGGLAAAVGLTRAGVDVQVFERHPQPDVAGFGLSLFGNGWTALDAVGAGDAVRRIASDEPARLRAGQRTPDGRWLSTSGAAAVSRLRLVHRVELHQAITSLLPDGTLRCGTTVEAVAESGQVTAVGPHGRTMTPFDVVVAADGIRSRVRASGPDDPGLRYVGYSAWRGVTDVPVDLAGAAGETWGRGQRLGYAPLRDGRVYWFAVATMARDAVVPDEHAYVRRLFEGWHAPIGSLLQATDPSGVRRLPIEELARPLRTYRRGRCVLLGDAAHAMTPDLGQGANQALEDAAELTHLLTPLATSDEPIAAQLDDALVTYDRRRRARTQPIAKRARQVGRVAQAEGRITSALRDAALRLVPDSAADRRLVALQGWSPGTGSR